MSRSRLVKTDMPPETFGLARQRVRSHLDHLAMVDYDLYQLAVNCYLQGARDMAEAVIARPKLLEPPGKPLDYQI